MMRVDSPGAMLELLSNGCCDAEPLTVFRLRCGHSFFSLRPCSREYVVPEIKDLIQFELLEHGKHTGLHIYGRI